MSMAYINKKLFSVHYTFSWLINCGPVSQRLHSRTQAEEGKPIWDIASVMTVAGGEYSGNTQGLLTALLRHSTHEFLLYVIGQSKSYVLV